MIHTSTKGVPAVSDQDTPPHSGSDDAGARKDAVSQRSAGAVARTGWTWFRAWRRTRPFWGGLITLLAGIWIVRAMNFGINLAITGGWSYSAGYTLGGALVLFGLTAWFAPHYKGLVGILSFIVALVAFVAANLGGYMIGTVLGVVGGSMIWAWGEKKPKKATGKAVRGRRARVTKRRGAADPELVNVDDASAKELTGGDTVALGELFGGDGDERGDS